MNRRITQKRERANVRAALAGRRPRARYGYNGSWNARALDQPEVLDLELLTSRGELLDMPEVLCPEDLQNESGLSGALSTGD